MEKKGTFNWANQKLIVLAIVIIGIILLLFFFRTKLKSLLHL
ncbi:MAG: hypothetical protein MAG795_01001 [Candidatus Woesearchaeota archaeon]|nr:hypothetical protein [Candidatus Woesearchaeota archaeon]